jgi:hypothetical protein
VQRRQRSDLELRAQREEDGRRWFTLQASQKWKPATTSRKPQRRPK